MKRTVAAVIGVAATVAEPHVEADAGRHLETKFAFDVTFSDTVVTYNQNLGMAVDVGLPADFGWQCTRLPVGPVGERTRGSFACSNDGWRTDALVMSDCKTTEVEARTSAAMRVHARRRDGRLQGAPTADAGPQDGGVAPAFGQYVDLAVSCETVARRYGMCPAGAQQCL